MNCLGLSLNLIKNVNKMKHVGVAFSNDKSIKSRLFVSGFKVDFFFFYSCTIIV